MAELDTDWDILLHNGQDGQEGVEIAIDLVERYWYPARRAYEIVDKDMGSPDRRASGTCSRVPMTVFVSFQIGTLLGWYGGQE